MITRKILFLVFTNEPCKRAHAFMYALDLSKKGHEIKLILDGDGTRCVTERSGHFGDLFSETQARNILVGTCKTASKGCDESCTDVTDAALEAGLPLLDDMDGHPGLGTFIADGYELVVF